MSTIAVLPACPPARLPASEARDATALRAMIAANLKMTVRNRQAIFWNLAFPAIFILIFGAVFGHDDGVDFAVGIAGRAVARCRTDAVAAMAASDAFTLHEGTAEDESGGAGGRRPRRGPRLRAGAGRGRLPDVPLAYDETEGPTATVAVSVVRQVLLEAAQGERPGADRRSSRSRAEDISYIDFFVPGILAMALMNSGVIGLSTAFVILPRAGHPAPDQGDALPADQLRPRPDRLASSSSRSRRR